MDIRFVHRGGHGNGGIHFCHLEQFADAWTRSSGNQPDALTMAAYIMSDDDAQAGKNPCRERRSSRECSPPAAPRRRRLEIEHISQAGRRQRPIHVASSEGSAEPEDDRARSFALFAFDAERSAFPNLGLRCRHRTVSTEARRLQQATAVHKLEPVISHGQRL